MQRMKEFLNIVETSTLTTARLERKLNRHQDKGDKKEPNSNNIITRPKRGSFQQRGREKIGSEPRANHVQKVQQNKGKKTKSYDDSHLILSCNSNEMVYEKYMTDFDNNTNEDEDLYASFVADLGATEHLTNTKAILKHLDKDSKIVKKMRKERQ